MKKNIAAIGLLILIFSFFSYTPDYSHSSGQEVTNFYYYKGSKFYLHKRTDVIFIKFKKEITETQARNILSEFPQLDRSAFPNNLKDAEFVKLQTSLSAESYKVLLSQLKQKNELEYAGHTFAPLGVNDNRTFFGLNDEFVAQFKASVSRQEIDNLNNINGVEIIERIDVSGGETYLMRVSANSSLNSMEMSNKYFLDGITNYAEPNLYCTNTKTDTTNDPFFGQQWAIRNLGNNVPTNPPNVIADVDMDIDSAWMLTQGDTAIKIAVIDTGTDTNHVDLKPNLLINLGYDFVNNVPGGHPASGDSHGTACGGVAAAVGNNVHGTAGVAFKCKIIPIRCISPGSSPYHVYANGFIWAYQKGADVISNSWGITGGASSLLDNAISDAARFGRNGKGSVICVASGNENTSQMRYPAISHPDIIVVGGLAPCNKRKSPTDDCSGETWGASFGENLDVVAPCVKIFAPIIGGGYTSSFNGTSSATPNTAGVCALMLSLNPDLTRKEVEAYLHLSAQKVGVYNYTTIKEHGGWNDEMGYGSVNGRLALQMVMQGLDRVSPEIYLDFPVLPGDTTAKQVNAIIRDNTLLASSSNAPRLYYKVNSGSFISLNASAISTDTFKFVIPGQSSGSVVEYYLAAQDTSLTPNISTLPEGGSGVTPPGTIPPANRFTYRTGNIITMQSTTTPKVCPDLQTVRDTISISIPGNPLILDIDVKLNLSHRNLSEVDVFLVKGAFQSELSTDNGGSGDSYFNTFFDSEALNPITSGSPPYTGRFRPEGPLTVFYNQNSNGQYILEFTDDASGSNTGTLDDWQLEITYSSPTGVTQTSIIPSEFSLDQNYPNPFNPMTKLKFSIPEMSDVKLAVYDIAGKEVTRLVSGILHAGVYEYTFDAKELSSGVYFYRLVSEGFVETKKMLFVK